MLLQIVVQTKMCLFENKTLSPSHVIFLLRRPCLCPLCMYVLTSWVHVPRILKQTRFVVKNKNTIAWKYMTYNLVQCDGFEK
jgi:hypothetical protein